MSIKVKKLSKVYGTQKALTEVSFEINKGEIVGFWDQMVQGNLPL